MADNMHDTGCKHIVTQKHRSCTKWIHIVIGCHYYIQLALLYIGADSTY